MPLRSLRATTSSAQSRALTPLTLDAAAKENVVVAKDKKAACAEARRHLYGLLQGFVWKAKTARTNANHDLSQKGATGKRAVL